MRDTIEADNILIKEGTPLPGTLGVETEPYMPGWGIVKGLNGYQFDREIRKSGWTFICLAREIKVTVFGINWQKMVRRAIQRILANPKSQGLNSLEIMGMTSPSSQRFPLIGYVRVSARSRQIQESMFLSQAKDLANASKRSESAGRSTESAREHMPIPQEPAKQPVAVVISSQ